MNRGTKKGNLPNKTAVSGDTFKDKEDKRLKESGIEYISSDRGTSKIPIEKTKTSKKKKYTGKISTGRGTSTT